MKNHGQQGRGQHISLKCSREWREAEQPENAEETERRCGPIRYETTGRRVGLTE